MKVKVLLFAQLKDLLGTNEQTLELKDGSTITDLMHFMMKESEIRDHARFPLLYSVNEEFVEGNRELHHQDVVGLLPPVSGG